MDQIRVAGDRNQCSTPLSIVIERWIPYKAKIVTCQLLGSQKWLLGEIVVNMLYDHEIHNDMYCTYHKTIRSLILPVI